MIEFHNRSQNALAEDFKVIATNRLGTLKKYSPSIERIRIDVLDGSAHKIKSHSHEISIQVQTSKKLFKAIGSGTNNLSAFDEAFESVENQLRKAHSKFSTSRSRKPGLRNLKAKEEE